MIIMKHDSFRPCMYKAANIPSAVHKQQTVTTISVFFLLKLRIKKFKIKLANQTLLVYVSSK